MVLVAVDYSGSFRVLESALHPDRDRSDEADCTPVL